MFRIMFHFNEKQYVAKVQKIDHKPIQFVVFDVVPGIAYLPAKLLYESNPVKDQLIYQSFDFKHKDILTLIGQTIFTTCNQQKIKVHL